ncbi:MAG: hypothetical protein AAF291_02580 [Pseudomonadota bacterium]
MIQTSPTVSQETATVPTTGPDLGAWMDRIKGRLSGLALALIAEILIIALLLTLGWNVAGDDEEGSSVLTTIEARNVTEEEPSPEESAPEPAQSEPEPEITPPQPQPVEPDPPTPPVLQPTPVEPPAVALPLPEAPPRPAPPAPKPPAAPAAPAPAYGPPDTGAPGSQFDSRRVGTAPNGEPMYAARWYREPTRHELAGYLSTATAPSTALIVCRTVPDFYVEDCELLGESPSGSNIGRAVLAATWQFRVRPAIVGGRSQVGSWVRIRIDYNQAVRR